MSQPTIMVPAATPTGPLNQMRTPMSSFGSSLAGVSFQGVKPSIAGGPVLQVATVNGTLVQTSKS